MLLVALKEGFLLRSSGHGQLEKAIPACPKRGLSRIEAAFYIGISPTKFDQLVADGRMPKAKQIDGRKVWDVRELDPAFEELGSVDISWDDVRENQEVSKGRI